MYTHIHVCVKLHMFYLSEKPLVKYIMKISYIPVLKFNRKLIKFSIKDELVQRHLECETSYSCICTIFTT